MAERTSNGVSQVALRNQLVPSFQLTRTRDMKKATVDHVPHVPAAGGTSSSSMYEALAPKNETVASCCSGYPDDDFDGLPESQRRWRASYRRTPGLQMSAPGMFGAALPPPDYRHGIATKLGDKVGDCLQTDFGTPAQDLILQQKEKIYRSRVFEPLGTHFSRNIKLPESYLTDPNARFGLPTHSSESVKQIIYPSASSSSADGATDFVSESDIAKQKNRNYNWGSVDPATHRFGTPAQNSDLSSSKAVRECLQPPSSTSAVPHSGAAPAAVAGGAGEEGPAYGRTRIASDRVQQFKAAHGHDVGHRRALVGTLASLPSDHTFGVKYDADDWTAKKAIEGSYTAEEQLPDKDLGRSVSRFPASLHGAAPEVPPNRVFGVPSTRYDKREPAVRSVADDTNYGTEHAAAMLLRPMQFSAPGVTTDSFQAARESEQVRKIFQHAGMTFSDAEFAQLVEATRARTGVLSVTTFRETMQLQSRGNNNGISGSSTTVAGTGNTFSTHITSRPTLTSGGSNSNSRVLATQGAASLSSPSERPGAFGAKKSSSEAIASIKNMYNR